MRAVARSAPEWETLVSDSFVPLVVDAVHDPGTGFRGQVDARDVGSGTSVNRVSADGSRLHRNVSSIGDAAPSVLFVMHRAGEGRVEQFDRRATQRPGQFVLYISDAPYTLEFPSAMSETVVHVPAATLGTPYGRLRELSAHSFPADAPVNGLHAYARAVLDGPADDARSARLGGTIAFLADTALSALVGSTPPSPTDAVLRTRAERFIELHAADPELSPDGVARAIAVSRRRLYGLFEQVGQSPGALIRDARTDLAVRILQSEPYSPVSSVWPRAGFRDQRTFLRAVLGRTGKTPSEVRARAHTSPSVVIED